MLFDCQLDDNYPLVRIEADSKEAARIEYFRRYRIYSSRAGFLCKNSAADSPAPVEPDAWVLRRKQLGTYDDPKAESVVAVDTQPVEKPIVRPASTPPSPPKAV